MFWNNGQFSKELTFMMFFSGSEASAFADNVLAVGGTLDYTDVNPLYTPAYMRAAIETYVSALKAGNVWNSIYTLPVFIGKTVEAHNLDLRRLALNNYTGFPNFWGYPTEFFGTVWHSPYGVQGNGVDGYAQNFCAPGAADNIGAEAKSMGFYANAVKALDATARWEMGTRDQNAFMDLASVVSSGSQVANALMYSSTAISGSNTNRDGFIIATQTETPNQVVIYRNNSSIGTGTVGVPVDFPTVPISSEVFMARNNGFGSSVDFHNSHFSEFFLGANLSSDQRLAFYNATIAFMTAIGRDAATVNPLFSTYGFYSTYTPSATNPSAAKSNTFNLRDVSCTRTMSQRTLNQGQLSETVTGSAGSGPSLTGKNYFAINPLPGLVTQTGAVYRVNDGNAYIETDTDHAARITQCPVSLVGGDITDVYNSYLAGTLGKKISDDLDAKIAGKVYADTFIFSTQDHSTATYVRNVTGWMNGVDMTCLPVWNNDSGTVLPYDNSKTYSPGNTASSAGIEYTYIGPEGSGHPPPNVNYWIALTGNKYSGILISDMDILMAKHRGLHQGTTMRWVDNSNVVHTRTIASIAVVGLPYPQNPDFLVARLSSALPAGIKPAKAMPKNIWRLKAPSIEGLGIPVVAHNQFNQALIKDLRNDNTIQPNYFNSATTAQTCGAVAPTNPQRAALNANLIEGDSGHGMCAILNNELIVLCTFLNGGDGGGGSSVNYNYDLINTALASLPGPLRQLTDATITSYPSYNQIDNYGNAHTNDFNGFAFNATTSTGYIALQPIGEAVSIQPATGSIVGVNTTAQSLCYWSCTGAADATPSGNITLLNFDGIIQGGLHTIDTCRLLNLTTLDMSNQFVIQETADILLPTVFTPDDLYLYSVIVPALQTLTMTGSDGIDFMELRGLSNLTAANFNTSVFTGFQMSGCTSINTLDLGSGSLSAIALNIVYTALPNRTGLTPGSLVASGNTGYGTSTPSIATAKNWIVT